MLRISPAGEPGLSAASQTHWGLIHPLGEFQRKWL